MTAASNPKRASNDLSMAILETKIAVQVLVACRGATGKRDEAFRTPGEDRLVALLITVSPIRRATRPIR